MARHKKVFFLWIESPLSERLAAAQTALEESIMGLGLLPVRFPAGRRLVPLGEVLKAARKESSGEALVWVNSDVLLTRDPFDVPVTEKVFGFYRRELPSGDINRGVDGYHIPCKWWDEYLCRDIPQLFLGASYVDWWISRAMEKVGAYENLSGYIDHVTHPQSPAAGSDRNPYYQQNFKSYNAWARRNGLEPIPAPPFLIPGLGHTWGAREAVRKSLGGILARFSR